MKCVELMELLGKMAPIYLAESWDNPGLLVGRKDKEIKKIITALDVTDGVIDEAVDFGADIIVTHHPLIFRPLKNITDLSLTGSKVLRLIENGINHYAMHTNLDTAFGGTNDTLCGVLGLIDVEPLAISCEQDGKPNGLGRIGYLPNKTTFGDFASFVKKALGLKNVTVVGDKNKIVSKAGLCTGAGFEFIDEASANGCDVYITSDVKFHDGQKAADMGMCLIDATHYGTENIIVPVLKEYIEKNINKMGYDVEVIVSKHNGQVFDYI